MRPILCASPKHRTSRRTGSTLLDVALGASLLTLLLIPSMHLMSQSEKNAQRSSLRQRLLIEADRIMHAQRVAMRDRATLDDAFGAPREELVKLSVDSMSWCLGRTTIVPEPTIGTKSTPLVTIKVDVWHDANGNAEIDADEVVQSLRTQQGQW